jgi:hypothetical protein
MKALMNSGSARLTGIVLGDSSPQSAHSLRRLLSVLLALALLTISGGAALGQDLSSADTEQHARLAEAFVNEKLAVWQRNLGLEDWKISIVMSRRSDLKPKTLGGIRWDKVKRSAVLWVLAVSEYQVPVREMLDDMELTVVHELIHIHLSSLPRSEASRRDEELAVNQLAQALLKLDRRR